MFLYNFEVNKFFNLKSIKNSNICFKSSYFDIHFFEIFKKNLKQRHNLYQFYSGGKYVKKELVFQ